MGIAIYPRDATEIDELLKRADEAMMEVKKSTKNAVRFTEK
jgi:GGDEF domain-containing protein